MYCDREQWTFVLSAAGIPGISIRYVQDSARLWKAVHREMIVTVTHPSRGADPLGLVVCSQALSSSSCLLYFLNSMFCRVTSTHPPLHPSNPEPGLQKQLHPSCTSVDSADRGEGGVSRVRACCGGEDVGGWFWEVGVQTNGRAMAGKEGSHQRANRRKHTVSTQQPAGPKVASDSHSSDGDADF